MSTNATIVLKLRREDIGHFKKCDVQKCNISTERIFGSLPNMGFIRDKVKNVKLSKPYIKIYHHWDGFPNTLGEWLKEHYRSYQDVLNLMLVGDCSSIIDGVIPYIGFDDDREWAENKPELLDEIPKCWYNYQYLAVIDPDNPEKVKWYWRDNKTWHDENGKFVKV